MLRKVIKEHKSTRAHGHRFILSTLSAFLLILAYPTFNFEFLVWVALVPLFFAVENKNIKQRFAIGYIFGIVFFSGILYWLFNVTVPGTIVLVLLLSLAPAIFSMLYLSPITYHLSPILAVPSAWVITEYLRSHVLTGFPWALLGYSQFLNLPVIQIVDITGVYGVSFIIVLINFCVFSTLKKLPQRVSYNFMGIGLTLITLLYGFFRLNQNYPTASPLEIAIIQGNIPQEIKWDQNYEKFILDRYEVLTLEAKKEKPDLIIWPETSVPGFLEDEKYIFDRVKNLAVQTDAYLLVGSIREESLKYYNSAMLLSKTGDVISKYDKIHLVLFGEYIPFEKYMPFFRDLIDKPIGDYDFGKEFNLFRIEKKSSVKTESYIMRDIRFYQFGVLICFEDIFPELARTFVKKGASFLVNITNDAWFGKTGAPYQHVQSSVFRAVENRVPVLRSANTGVSCFIDQKGEIFGSVTERGKEIFVDGYKVNRISPSSKKPTLYTSFGDIFCLVCLFVFVGSLLKPKK